MREWTEGFLAENGVWYSRKGLKMDIQHDLELAKKGRDIWIDIKNDFSYEALSGCVVMMPTDNRELNRAALEKLPDYMEKKYLKKAVIICRKDMEILQTHLEKINAAIFIKQLAVSDLECLLKYYRLVQFTKNIVAVSLEEPFGNAGIIGREGITLKDYVADALYV